MAINLKAPDVRELKPHITVFGVGGAGGNAVNNMIESGLEGVEFVVANTDAQALASSKAPRVIQMGLQVTQGLGAGSQPEVGAAAAEEVIDEIRDQLSGSHMVFITAGMGGGTGTGAAPVIARAARDMGILTVGVVTKPFQFEGLRRMRLAEAGVNQLQEAVDTLIVIPNQNLFRIANDKTTFADAFAMADQVLHSGVASVTDLMVKEGLINLDFADVRAVMRGMGKAMMGTGESSGEKRAIAAAEAAIANPLLDDVSMKGAKGLLISITGGPDMTLFEVDEAATRIREEVDPEANIILGATFDATLEGIIRVSVVATGIDSALIDQNTSLTATEQRISEVAERLRAEARARVTAPQGSPGLTRSSTPVEPQPQMSEPVRPMAVDPQPQPALTLPPLPTPSYTLPPQQVRRDDVVVTPVAPRQAVMFEPAPAPRPVVEDRLPPQTFVPPQAERVMRPVRMPRVDELPVPAQNQIHASRNGGEMPHEQKRMSLLQRLATVGFGARREDENETPQAQYQPQPAPRMEPQYQPQSQQPSQVHMEYSRRPPQPQPQGQRPFMDQPRPPSLHSADDEQLEIPAFLRRQAN